MIVPALAKAPLLIWPAIRSVWPLAMLPVMLALACTRLAPVPVYLSVPQGICTGSVPVVVPLPCSKLITLRDPVPVALIEPPVSFLIAAPVSPQELPLLVTVLVSAMLILPLLTTMPLRRAVWSKLIVP